MSIADDFKMLCEDIALDNLTDMKTSAEEIAKKLNKHYYELEKDTSSHLYIVGSVGRGTAIKGSSDLDIIFDLPDSIYKQFDAYQTNGQSALLQDVKDVLKERYPNTTMKGDGQVVVIEFAKYTVELVPAFKQSDDRFKYPDTHDGGSWKYTDPISEQDECSACNDRSTGAYFNFCHLIRKWKNQIGLEFGGLLIDTLIYNHFSNKEDYSNSTYDDYLTILKDIFSFFKNQDKDQNYWLAVGSKQQVHNTANGAFVSKAKSAYSKLNDAILKGKGTADVLKELFGADTFKSASNLVLKEFCASSFNNTEQFIENLFPVDIRYSLQIDCKVSQDGWRDFYLLKWLKEQGILRRNKKLDFFIDKTDCPPPYSIYWKVRNVGPEAERRDCIRGQIKKTDSTHQKESTDFYGPHYVECYLIKNGVCVARSRIDVPIGNG